MTGSPVFISFPLSSKLTEQYNSRILYLITYSQAFAPSTPFVTRGAIASPTELEASRINAKKEKRIRNRLNMRQFRKKGKISRKRQMRKIASGDQREVRARSFSLVTAAEFTFVHGLFRPCYFNVFLFPFVRSILKRNYIYSLKTNSSQNASPTSPLRNLHLREMSAVRLSHC